MRTASTCYTTAPPSDSRPFAKLAPSRMLRERLRATLRAHQPDLIGAIEPDRGDPAVDQQPGSVTTNDRTRYHGDGERHGGFGRRRREM